MYMFNYYKNKIRSAYILVLTKYVYIKIPDVIQCTDTQSLLERFSFHKKRET